MDFGLAAVGARRGHSRRHAGVHGAGAARRPRGHRAQRHLRARPGAVRVVHRPARVHGEDAGRAGRAAGGRHADDADSGGGGDRSRRRTRDHPLPRTGSPAPSRLALAVSAALPGGDPLAAALAAGETPSPEMVAAAGGELPALTPRQGVVLLAVVVGCFSRSPHLPIARPSSHACRSPSRDRCSSTKRRSYDRRSATRRPWRTCSPAITTTPTISIGRSATGQAPPVGSNSRPPSRRRGVLVPVEPEPPRAVHQDSNVSISDPPMISSGMVRVDLDPQGRLTSFRVVP